MIGKGATEMKGVGPMVMKSVELQDAKLQGKRRKGMKGRTRENRLCVALATTVMKKRKKGRASRLGKKKAGPEIERKRIGKEEKPVKLLEDQAGIRANVPPISVSAGMFSECEKR